MLLIFNGDLNLIVYCSIKVILYLLLDIILFFEFLFELIISFGFLFFGLVFEFVVLFRFFIEISGILLLLSLLNFRGWVCCFSFFFFLFGWENDWFFFLLLELLL